MPRQSSISTVALKSALASVEKSIADLSAARERKESLNREVTELLTTCNPDDESQVAKCSLRRTQAEMLPGLITRLGSMLGDEHIPSLVAEIKVVERELKSADLADVETFIDEHEPMLSEHFPVLTNPHNGGRTNQARPLLSRSALCPRLPRSVVSGEIGHTTLSHQRITDRPQDYDGAAILRAKELIKIADGWVAYEPKAKGILGKIF